MRGDSSNEARISNEFALATADVRALASASGNDAVSRTLASTLDALMLFGISDAYKRKTDRQQELRIRGPESQRLADRNDRYNSAGLRTLQGARDHFRQLERDLEGIPATDTRIDGDEADEMLRSFNAEITELDLRPNEVREFGRHFADIVAAARDEGAGGVIRVAHRGIDELDQARRRPDRGGNPWWKGLGLMVGLAAIFTQLTLCQFSPHLCPDWLRALLAILALVGAIAFLLC